MDQRGQFAHALTQVGERSAGGMLMAAAGLARVQVAKSDALLARVFTGHRDATAGLLIECPPCRHNLICMLTPLLPTDTCQRS